MGSRPSFLRPREEVVPDHFGLSYLIFKDLNIGILICIFELMSASLSPQFVKLIVDRRQVGCPGAAP